ncbi:MAG: NAD(P)/FAD-dependent oxidoreductase [Lachnospiraceae bacterium]|jgi:thioredoxin reductase (NADPH)|nr:NAD(P)/FAD-dependent oxidoreductase [Lachnospiraceae bacterium]
MQRYDIAIIGTGPAGLSAALTAKVRNKSILLIGSKNSSVKVEKAHEIQNYLGLPKIAGADMQKAFLDHVASMDIEITEGRVSTVYAMGDYYSLQVGEEMVEASSVILATGVVQGKPLPGEEEFLGRGVSYCATCDAALYKGKKTIVVAYAKKEEAEANFLAEMAGEVVYIPMYQEEVEVSDKVKVVKAIPKEITGALKANALVTDQGTLETDGIFILREAVAPGQLVPGLETEGPHVKVDVSMKTNLAGCFACGDIAGIPYQYIKSAGQGNVAALSAVAYLDQKKHSA